MASNDSSTATSILDQIIVRSRLVLVPSLKFRGSRMMASAATRFPPGTRWTYITPFSSCSISYPSQYNPPNSNFIKLPTVIHSCSPSRTITFLNQTSRPVSHLQHAFLNHRSLSYHLPHWRLSSSYSQETNCNH